MKTKFEKQAMTYNGVAGYMWTKWELIDGAYVHAGKKFFPKKFKEAQVVVLFDAE